MTMLTKAEVIQRIGQGQWEAFLRFMRGQTVVVGTDGGMLYYECDIDNFLSPGSRFFD